MWRPILFSILLATSTVIFFQNCAETSFSGAQSSVAEKLDANIGPEDQTVLVGGQASFMVQIGSPGSVTYQWLNNGFPISGERSSSLDIFNAQLEDAGTYSVEVVIDGEPYDTMSAELEVLICLAGQTKSCSANGISGIQYCSADGMGYGSCQVQKGAALSCDHPSNDSKIGHGQSVKLFKDAYAVSCQSEDRTCNDGVLSGSYKHIKCSKSCKVPWSNSYIQHGKSLTAWNASSSTSCKSQKRTCNNGSLSGSYTKSSCKKTCSSGKVLRDGKCLTAKKTFSLGSKSCGSGYCSTNKPKKGGGNKAHCATKDRNKADTICKVRGFKKSSGTMHFSSRGKKARYCGPTGKGCFTNKNNSCNRYFTKITCVN